MKILCYSKGLHHKNLYALTHYKNIRIDFFKNLEELSNINLLDYEIVYSPAESFYVNRLPTMKFIFGPHFSTFPNQKIQDIIGNNSIYIQPSQWTVDIWKQYPITKNLRIESIPFGVDTNKFNQKLDISSRNKVFIYFKNRNPLELRYLEHLLLTQNIEYKVFDYKKKYDEAAYINYLQEAKYGIWLGCHESQGFALQEALSCNVPLFVWSVKSMKQEYGCNYDDVPATSIPYWDERCGEVVYDINNFIIRFKEFLLKLETYNPRQYVIEHLSMDVCEQKFIRLCNDLSISF
jgi:hypothetical protein